MNPPTRKDALLEKMDNCYYELKSKEYVQLMIFAKEPSASNWYESEVISETCEKSENILVLRIYPSEQLIAHKHILSLVHSPK